MIDRLRALFKKGIKSHKIENLECELPGCPSKIHSRMELGGKTLSLCYTCEHTLNGLYTWMQKNDKT